MRRRWVAGLVPAVAVLALAAACGGGDGGVPVSQGERITDPARVPSSTPIQDAAVFKIENNVITLAGGTGAGSPVAGQTPANSGTKTYTVKPGDTCGAIASQFGIAVADLLKANRTIDAGCTNLHEGDILRVPGAATTGGAATPTVRAGSGKTYTVKAGDTCDAIARSYGVDVNLFIQVNGLDAGCRNLQPGQTVRIP